MTAGPLRWALAPPASPELVAPLAGALNIPSTLAALLVQRGYALPEDAKRFLRPGIESLSDPYVLRDMDRAVELVARAVREGRPILVHGDYDVDGQSATALLTRVLREAGAVAIPFVPHRVRDGYDFGPAAIIGGKPTRSRKLTNHMIPGPDHTVVHPGLFPHQIGRAHV